MKTKKHHYERMKGALTAGGGSAPPAPSTDDDLGMILPKCPKVLMWVNNLVMRMLAKQTWCGSKVVAS